MRADCSARAPSRPPHGELTQSELAETILVPSRGLAARLLALAERRGVSGAGIFDLQLGLIAVEAGATEIWTHDARFLTLPGLQVVDPLRVVDPLQGPTPR